MKTIGIIGANGQVGSELCLYLKQWTGVRVVAICRSDLAAAFLRRFSVECRCGNMRKPEDARRLLEGCDLVADFSLPGGILVEMIDAIRGVVTNALSCAPPGVPFVYASSEMAFGMRHADGEPFRNYWLSRSVYGVSKRFGERLAARLGRSTGHAVYSLRLGQVHGEMQNVSRNLLTSLRDEIAWVPDAASDTVFVYTIAEALVHIAEGRESPGLYTLVSQPQWSWKEVHEYYARRRNITASILTYRPETSAVPLFARVTAALRSRVVAKRDVISGYVLRWFPNLQWKMAAAYRVRSAAAQIAGGRRKVQYRPYEIFFGSVPGRRLQSLSDSRQSMDAPTRQLRQTIESSRPASHGTKLTTCGS